MTEQGRTHRDGPWTEKHAAATVNISKNQSLILDYLYDKGEHGGNAFEIWEATKAGAWTSHVDTRCLEMDRKFGLVYRTDVARPTGSQRSGLVWRLTDEGVEYVTRLRRAAA